MIFDFPQPFGPITPVKLLGNVSVVGSTKVLKPANFIFVRRIIPTLNYNIFFAIILPSGDIDK